MINSEPMPSKRASLNTCGHTTRLEAAVNLASSAEAAVSLPVSCQHQGATEKPTTEVMGQNRHGFNLKPVESGMHTGRNQIDLVK